MCQPKNLLEQSYLKQQFLSRKVMEGGFTTRIENYPGKKIISHANGQSKLEIRLVDRDVYQENEYYLAS